MWRLIAKSIQRPSAAYLFPDRIEVDFSSAATRKTYIPTLARTTYASALAEARNNYVAARRLQGVGPLRIMVSDVLPNCLSPVIVQATLLLAIGIIIEASVSFVGLGVQPPQPSWGNMLADARNYLFSGEWWLSVFPGAAISLSVVAFNLLGDGLRDALDPRHSTSALAA